MRHAKQKPKQLAYWDDKRKMLVRVGLPLAVLLLVAIAGVRLLDLSHAATTCTVSAKLENSCHPWLGVWAASYPQAGTGTINQVEYHEQRIGRKVDLVKDYIRPGGVIGADDKHFIDRPNTYAVITWKPVTKWSDGAGGNATINAQIDKMADSVKSLGSKKIFLSVHHEAENDVSGGSSCGATVSPGSAGTPAQFRAMWENVRNRFDAKGVTNVVWTWMPMGYRGWFCMEKDLYPGNSLVDWIMYDPYVGGDADSWDKTISGFYNWLENNSDTTHNFNSKIWGIAEVSSHLTTKANAQKTWVDAKQSLDQNTYPRLKAYMVFDSDNGKPDNRIMYWCDPNTVTQINSGSYHCGNLQQDPAEQAAYKAFANDPHFNNALFTNDTTAPNVSVTSGKATVEIGTKTTLTATATDNAWVAKVAFYADGTLLSTDTTYPYSFTWQPATAGTHTVTAIATDTAGLNRTSAAVTVTVIDDMLQPTVSLTGPADGLTVQSGLPIAITAAATDNSGIVSKVEFYRNGTTLLGSDNNSPFSFTWYTAGTEQGDYTLTAKAYDQAGNTATSDPVSVTLNGVTGDTEKPTVTIDVSPSSIMLGQSASATAVASDNVGVDKVEIYVDGSLRTTLRQPPYTYSWTPTTVSVKQITAKAYDAAGNFGQSASPATLIVNPVGVLFGDIGGNNDGSPDGKVNGADYSIIVGHLGQKYEPANLDRSADGIVSAGDLAVLLNHWTW